MDIFFPDELSKLCFRYICFINSRTAIAGAIIGLLLVFLQFKEFELYWGAVFLRLEEYWRSPFLINFIGVNLKREMKRAKKFEVILVLNKSEEWSEKRVVFVHTAVEKLMWKNFL